MTFLFRKKRDTCKSRQGALFEVLLHLIFNITHMSAVRGSGNIRKQFHAVTSDNPMLPYDATQ